MRWRTDVVLLDLLCAAMRGFFFPGDGRPGTPGAWLWPAPGTLSSQECMAMVGVCWRLLAGAPAEHRAELEARAQAYFDARLTGPDHGDMVAGDLVFPFADELLDGPNEWRCRKCGCTQERACPGGCHWVTSDLCSSCATAGIRRALEPAPVNGRHWEDRVPAGGGNTRVVRGFVPTLVADPIPEGGEEP